MSHADLLTLTQWLSPAFPLGSFAYSHGLEQVITDGTVGSGETLESWLRLVLQQGTGAVDATLLCLSLKGEDVADAALALAPSRERLEETLAQGRAFAEAVNAVRGDSLPVMALPVAVGVAARALCLPAEQVAVLYLHSFTSNLVSAAVRFVPLGQNDGQRVLAHLHPVIEAVAHQAAHTPLDKIGSAAFGADMAAMRHETMDVRIFKT